MLIQIQVFLVEICVIAHVNHVRPYWILALILRCWICRVRIGGLLILHMSHMALCLLLRPIGIFVILREWSSILMRLYINLLRLTGVLLRVELLLCVSWLNCVWIHIFDLLAIRLVLRWLSILLWLLVCLIWI